MTAETGRQERKKKVDRRNEALLYIGATGRSGRTEEGRPPKRGALYIGATGNSGRRRVTTETGRQERKKKVDRRNEALYIKERPEGLQERQKVDCRNGAPYI